MRVGDYVRNQYGIAKLVNIEKSNADIYVFDRDICFLVNKDTGEIKERINKLPITEYIDLNKIKSSPNIIDLIEVGDYVNGRKVSKINLDMTFNKEKSILCGDFDYDCLETIYTNEDIKSIVTKEQFESIECRIGG